MIKRIAFVCRNPSLSVDEFHARWRGPHADLFAAEPGGAGPRAALRAEPPQAA